MKIVKPSSTRTSVRTRTPVGTGISCDDTTHRRKTTRRYGGRSFGRVKTGQWSEREPYEFVGPTDRENSEEKIAFDGCICRKPHEPMAARRPGDGRFSHENRVQTCAASPCVNPRANGLRAGRRLSDETGTRVVRFALNPRARPPTYQALARPIFVNFSFPLSSRVTQSSVRRQTVRRDLPGPWTRRRAGATADRPRDDGGFSTFRPVRRPPSHWRTADPLAQVPFKHPENLPCRLPVFFFPVHVYLCIPVTAQKVQSPVQYTGWLPVIGPTARVTDVPLSNRRWPSDRSCLSRSPTGT